MLHALFDWTPGRVKLVGGIIGQPDEIATSDSGKKDIVIVKLDDTFKCDPQAICGELHIFYRGR